MSRTISSGKHYGVEVHVRVSESVGCCGIGTLHGFATQVNSQAELERLTNRQKNKLYRALMHNILDYTECWGILMATDAVDGWSGGNAGGGRPVKDMCMADFCRYFNFRETAMGENGNSGNGVAAFTIVTYPRAGDRMYVEMPKFPMPKKTRRARRNSSGVRADIVAELRAAIHQQ